MKALVVTAPHRAEVLEVDPPAAVPGEVVVAVGRAGICGTDVEFFTGEMQYLHTEQAAFPMRLGHEWMGTVVELGDGVDPGWLGRRVTGDTMLGCGVCARCRTGRQHVCADRAEIGIRAGRPGALAERLAVPVTALHALPDAVDDIAGALVEPGGNAWRAVDAAALAPGDRALILGPGTIGLLCGLFAAAAGVEVHVLGRSARSLEFAGRFGFAGGWTEESLPELAWDAVIDATNAPTMPALAVSLVDPGRRVVFVGLSGTPSLIDSRDLALADVTAVGVLSASPGLTGAIDAYASGAVDPRPLVAATVTLDELPGILAGRRPTHSGPGPKIHVRLGD
jgi:threonine dehydrogenase-like Zn-dependent dehydrogenase